MDENIYTHARWVFFHTDSSLVKGESNESSYERWPAGDTEGLYAHLSPLILLC